MVCQLLLIQRSSSFLRHHFSSLRHHFPRPSQAHQTTMFAKALFAVLALSLAATAALAAEIEGRAAEISGRGASVLYSLSTLSSAYSSLLSPTNPPPSPATYYLPENNYGACGTRIKNTDYAVALSSDQYGGGSHCGCCIVAKVLGWC